MRRATPLTRFVTYAVLLAGALPVVIPMLWMLSVALRENRHVFSIPLKLVPPAITFEAFEAVFSDPDRMRLYLNSYIISIAVTVICVITASLAGYGFSRFRFRGKTTMLAYILLTQMFPLVLLAVPYFLFMSRVGLYDSYLALILANASFALPFCMLMLRDFVGKIPRELDEAALVDGCSTLRAFFTIILPTMSPGLVATAVYAFILSWNEFLFAVVLTNSVNARPLTVGIAMLQGEFRTFWNEIMAMSILGSLPLILAFLLVQKYLLAGFTAGSIKG